MAPKKSFFKKPEWAGNDAKATTDDGAGIFSRNVVYEGIIEAERRNREKTLAEGKSTPKPIPEPTNDEAETPSSKRRRVAKELEDESKSIHSDQDGISDRDATPKASSSTPTRRKPTSNGQRATNRTSSSPPRQPGANSTTISTNDGILIDSSDNEDGTKIKSRKSKAAVKTTPAKKTLPPQDRSLNISDDEDDEKDEYLRELKRKAREKARRQRLGISEEPPQPNLHNETPFPDTLSPKSPPDNEIPSSISLNSPKPEPTNQFPPPALDDPEIKILITTLIPGTKPLIVTRRASQEIKPAIEVWCHRQGFDQAGTSKVFFTWRGKRLYNTTTMNGILKQLRREHIAKGGVDLDPSEGKIHVEAVTQEIFEKQQKEKERRQELAEKGILSDHDDHTDDDASRNESNEPSGAGNGDGSSRHPPSDQGGVVIRLTCQGIEPLMLRVRPNTSIAKIMAGFQKTRGIDPAKKCWLVFDGERLEPESVVADAGFEDEDVVEVHVR